MNKKKLSLTILIVFILFIAFVLCKNLFSYRIPNPNMGVRSVVARGNIDTLFIGSSGYRKGVDMEALVSHFGEDVFMLTYNGNEPYNIYIELKEILKEDVTINRLIIDFNPSMMDRGADLSDKRLLWDISMDGKMELWNAISKEEGTTFFTFYDYFVLSNNDYMVTYPISYPLISGRYLYGGSTQADETAGKSAEELNAMEVIENEGINELQRESIINIIELCRKNNIDVTFLESPRYFTMEENPQYADKSEQLQEIITSAGGKYVLRQDLDFDNKNADYYSDLTHMSGKGRKVFTEKLIKNWDIL